MIKIILVDTGVLQQLYKVVPSAGCTRESTLYNMTSEVNEKLKRLWREEGLNAEQLEETLVQEKGGRPTDWVYVKQTKAVDDKGTVWVFIRVGFSSKRRGGNYLKDKSN